MHRMFREWSVVDKNLIAVTELNIDSPDIVEEVNKLERLVYFDYSNPDSEPLENFLGSLKGKIEVLSAGGTGDSQLDAANLQLLANYISDPANRQLKEFRFYGYDDIFKSRRGFRAICDALQSPNCSVRSVLFRLELLYMHTPEVNRLIPALKRSGVNHLDWNCNESWGYRHWDVHRFSAILNSNSFKIATALLSTQVIDRIRSSSLLKNIPIELIRKIVQALPYEGSTEFFESDYLATEDDDYEYGWDSDSEAGTHNGDFPVYVGREADDDAGDD